MLTIEDKLKATIARKTGVGVECTRTGSNRHEPWVAKLTGEGAKTVPSIGATEFQALHRLAAWHGVAVTG